MRTFQRSAMFSDFSVLDNVLIARHLHAREGCSARSSARCEAWKRPHETRALEILDFIGLSAFKDELAPNLSHGHQRALGVAMALANRAPYLMLDERSPG